MSQKTDARHGMDLTQGKIPSLLPRFAWPFLMSGAVQALYGIVDMIIVGQFCDTEVISGVVTGAMFLQTVFVVMNGVAMSGAVLIGRKVGEKDDRGCAHAVGTYLTAGAVVALFFTALILALRLPVLDLLQTPDLAKPHAQRYVLFAALGMPFLVAFNVVCAVSRGLGDSRTPGIVIAAGCFINIGLSFLLTGYFKLEELGVAVAASVSHFLTFAIIGGWMLRKKFPFLFKFSDFKPDRVALRAIARVGLPLLAQDWGMHISFMITTAVINSIDKGLGGEVVIASASVGIVSRIFQIGGMVPLAMGNSVAAIAAQNLGARRRDRALAAMRWGIIYSLCAGACFLLWWQFAPTSITSLFADSDASMDVISGAAAYLRAFSLDLITLAFLFGINAYLSACGKANVSMLHSMAAAFLVRVPMSIVFSRLPGLTLGTLNSRLYLLGLASPAASTLSLAICVAYLFYQHKKLKKPGAAA